VSGFLIDDRGRRYEIASGRPFGIGREAGCDIVILYDSVSPASVERVNAGNQEITLKGPDGSRETIMISGPDYLSRVKVGDQVMITRRQALALSLEKGGLRAISR